MHALAYCTLLFLEILAILALDLIELNGYSFSAMPNDTRDMGATTRTMGQGMST